jgi:hypothetical protein
MEVHAMHRFVIEHNIQRFESALRACDNPADRVMITGLLRDARRELASLPTGDASLDESEPPDVAQ